MVAAKKSKAVRQAEENLVLAQLNVQTAEARQRIRLAEIQTKLAWLIALKKIFLGPGLVALLTVLFPIFKK